MPPTPSTPDAAWGQQINDNFAWLNEDRPALQAFTIAQDILSEDPTTLEDAQLEAPADGLYLVSVHVASTSSPDGGTRRYVRLWNGATQLAMRQGRSAVNGTFYSEVNCLARLDEGDTITVQVYQDSAATQTFLARLTALLVAP